MNNKYKLDRYPEVGEFVKRTIGSEWFIAKIIDIEKIGSGYISCRVSRIYSTDGEPGQEWNKFYVWKNNDSWCNETYHTEILSEDEVIAYCI